ncbi:MAG TPA: LEPR-XLL domain-containing protein, partial [Phycisphaerae bacterium]|nr:LEPR-XLL domain-containing protein [Phycisphaerae bacterium]
MRSSKRLASHNGALVQQSGPLDAGAPAVEALEPRLLLSLIGVSPQFPLISYDANEAVSYDAASDALHVSATPLTLVSPPSLPESILLGQLTIDIQVDDTGTLVGGVPADDLVVVGKLASGSQVETLLTGEIIAFGYQDGGSGPYDQYDFVFTATGGSLLGAFAGLNIGVILDSENSSFVGSFAANFGGGAKGTLGSTETPPGVEAAID